MDNPTTMNMRDKLYMPPLEKYIVYSRFPWKIALHLVLLTLVTSELILVLNKNAMYSLGQYRLWNKLYLDKDANGGSQANIVDSYNLFNAKSLTEYVKHTIETYYDVNDQTLANYEYLYEDGLKKPPQLEVEYLDSDAVGSGRWKYQYELTRTELGPFAMTDVKEFLKEVRSFTLKFSLSHYLPEKLDLFATCYVWDITQMYNFGSRGVVNVSMNSERRKCQSSTRKPYSAGFLSGYLWLSMSVAVLSLLCFSLTWSSLMRRAVIVAKLKGQEVRAKTAWEGLDFTTKLKFFNFWVVTAIIGNLCQFFGSLCNYINEDSFIKTQETLTGFGCFFAWVTTVGYLQHNSVAYTIINTLKRALPVTIPFVVGMFPIFMAYAFLGVALFWPTGYFPNPMMSMVVLFALINGDSVYMFSTAMADTYFFLGQLYHFTFLVFFIW